MKNNFLSDEIFLNGDTLVSLQTVLKEKDSQTEILSVNSADLNLFHIFQEDSGNKIALLDEEAQLRLEARKPIEIGKLKEGLLSKDALTENTADQLNKKASVGFFLSYDGRVLEVSLSAMYMLMSQLAISQKYNQKKSFVRNAYIASQLRTCKKNFMLICRKDPETGKTRIYAILKEGHIYLPQSKILQVIEKINATNSFTGKYGVLHIKKWLVMQQQTYILCVFDKSRFTSECGIMLELSDTREKGWYAYETIRKEGTENYLIGTQLKLKNNIADMSKIIIQNYVAKGERVKKILREKEKDILFLDLDLTIPENKLVYHDLIDKLFHEVFTQLKLSSLLGKKRTEVVIEYILDSVDFSKHLSEADFMFLLMSIPDILSKEDSNVSLAVMNEIRKIAFNLPFQKFDFTNLV